MHALCGRRCSEGLARHGAAIPASILPAGLTMEWADFCRLVCALLAFSSYQGGCWLAGMVVSVASISPLTCKQLWVLPADTPQWRLGPMICRELCNKCGTRWQRAKNHKNPFSFFIWVSSSLLGRPLEVLDCLPLVNPLASKSVALPAIGLGTSRCQCHADD